MFGGTLLDGDRYVNLGETWRWDGHSWTPGAVSGPAARVGSAMWSDLVGTFLFGGAQMNGTINRATMSLFQDTWRWNGMAWTQLTPAVAPPPRWRAGVAFDLGRSRAVLFGGDASPICGTSIGCTLLLGDTWTFDGTQWQQQPVASPAPPAWHGMAYDLLRNRVVLFGGVGVAGDLADTWEWNGADWQPMAPAASPPGGAASMEFDLQVGRITVKLSNSGRLFRYDGTTWIETVLATQAYHGYGVLVNRLQAQRLELVTATRLLAVSQAPAFVASYGNGCGNDPPLLSARSWPRVGATDFGLELLRAPARAPVGIVGGLQQATLPVGACTQLVAPVAASVFLLANTGGSAELGIAIPPNPALLGTTLFFQGAALDPGAPLGFNTTAGLRVVVGD